MARNKSEFHPHFFQSKLKKFHQMCIRFGLNLHCFRLRFLAGLLNVLECMYKYFLCFFFIFKIATRISTVDSKENEKQKRNYC